MVWCSITSGFAYVVMMTIGIESKLVFGLCAFVYMITFFIGVVIEHCQKDKITNLEKEINELKEEIKHRKSDFKK